MATYSAEILEGGRAGMQTRGNLTPAPTTQSPSPLPSISRTALHHPTLALTLSPPHRELLGLRGPFTHLWTLTAQAAPGRVWKQQSSVCGSDWTESQDWGNIDHGWQWGDNIVNRVISDLYALFKPPAYFSQLTPRMLEIKAVPSRQEGVWWILVCRNWTAQEKD